MGEKTEAPGSRRLRKLRRRKNKEIKPRRGNKAPLSTIKRKVKRRDDTVMQDQKFEGGSQGFTVVHEIEIEG